MDSQITTKYTIPRIVGIPTIPNSPRTPIQLPRRPQVPPNSPRTPIQLPRRPQVPPNSPRTPIQSPRRPQVPPAPRKRRQISDKDLEYWRLDLIKKIIKKMIKLKG